MKTIVIAGDDTEKINLRLRQLIQSAKEKSYSISKISDANVNLESLLRASDLFFDKKFILVEKISFLTKDDFAAISKYSDFQNLVLCILSQKAVSRQKLKLLGSNLKVESYNLPAVIWKFLDSLKPKNAKNALDYLSKVSEVEPIELTFHLLSQRFIQLYLAKVKPSELKLQSWQVVRLQSQAENYSERDIKALIEKLSEIDVEAKTGKGDLRSLLDFFIAANLE